MSAPRVTTAPKVVAVTESSPAARSGLRSGDELLSLNGRSPRDVIEYSLLVDEPELDLVVRRRGLPDPVALAVRKQPGEPLGIEVSSAVFDRVRTCDNHCEFCFIHQLPKGMRRSLSMKDDDYRLSFLYGNFTTLTRFTEMDLERVLTERLSPLFVSIHATDPDRRADLLRNRRGATSLRWLGALLEGGIEVPGQVVVCPGRNDGQVLEDTLAGVLDRYPTLATVACVPLGVSRFSHEEAMRPHTRDEAAAVCDTVMAWQDTFLSAIGRRMVFAADEYYLMAERPFPLAHTYEGFPQHENGLGMARAFEAAFGGDEHAALGVRPGFFAAVDGAPASGYRARRAPGAVHSTHRGAPVAILTGEYGRQGAGSPGGVPPAPRHPTDARCQPLLRGEHRGLGPPDRHGPDRGAPAPARRAPVPAAGLVPLGGTVPRRPDRRRPAPPSRGGSHRRAVAPACVGARRCTGGGDRGRSVDRSAHPRAGARHPGRTPMTPTDVGRGPEEGNRPLVVVAGRPNVGKSTLVNRIVGRRAAVVEERPGVTRDRKELDAEWCGHAFTVVDTGGWLSSDDPLDAQVSAQAERAIAEAAVILFVVDVTIGLTDEDLVVARVLKRSGRPVRVVVNKVDSSQRESDAWEAVSL